MAAVRQRVSAPESEVGKRSRRWRRTIERLIDKPLPRITIITISAILTLGLGAGQTAAAATLHSGQPCETFPLFCEINPAGGYSVTGDSFQAQGFLFDADAQDRLTVRITVGVISCQTLTQGCDMTVELGLGVRPHVSILDRQIPSDSTATASYAFTNTGRYALAINDPQEGPYDLTITLNPARTCVLPKLVGQTLAQARANLKKADCSLGRVTKRGGRRAHLVVVGQEPAAHKKLRAGAKVRVRLG